MLPSATNDAPLTLTAHVRQAQAGNRTAFDALARHYRPLLFTIAFLRSADTGEAEDLVQEALAQAWRRLPTLKDPTAFPGWLRAILVHACNAWYRKGQRRVPTRPLDEARNLVAEGSAATPIASLLGREQQRELHQALLILPEANRIALLLHVWGGYSYAEIAVLTDVPPSTIEGRIYRAKRQLRARLRDEGEYFLREPRPLGNNAGATKSRVKDNTMTTSSRSAPQPESADLPLLGVLFNDRFSRLIDGGVSLVRALQALEEMPAPYGPAIADIRQRLEIRLLRGAGEYLSGPMKDYPHLFSPFYIALIRAGEVAGILEEALQRARRVTAREWELARRRPATETPLYLTLPSNTPIPADWADLSEYQRLAALSLLCSALSMLLASGVPMLQALAVSGELLPIAQRAAMEEVRAAVREAVPLHQALERLGILPPFVLAFLEVGFAAGTLDSTLYLAAETIEQELNCRFAERA